MLPRTHRGFRRASSIARAAARATGLTIALAGCSGDDAGSGAPTSGANGLKSGSVVGGVGGKTVGPGPTTTPTPAPKPRRATCSMLSRATAAKLLGSAPTARKADVRQWPPGTSELDGCTYVAGNSSLQYVAWSTQSAAAKVTPPPVPGNAPAQRFNPGVGQSSAGVAITAGGRTTAEVSAYAKGRLVQVTATAPDAGAARRAAIEAARTVISAR